MKFLTLMLIVNFVTSVLISSASLDNLSLRQPKPATQSVDSPPYVARVTLTSGFTQKKKKKKDSDTTTNDDKSEDTAIKYNPSIGSRLTPGEVEKLLETHNKARADVGVEQVTWSSQLATYAQEWADHLVSTSCDLEHRPSSGKWELRYGENLFMGSSRYYEVTSAVKSWEEEKKNYNGQAIDNNNRSRSGHYTQMVWKTTKQIGCAKVECKRNIIVVCNYDPPGNEQGQKPY
jgi:pathogenesis-related protein 1